MTIPYLIHTVAFDEASSNPREQTQNSQEPMLHEPITLLGSMKERRNVIPNYYELFL